MPVKIERLTCRVSVKTGRKKTVLHGSPAPAKPTMHFALPSAEPRSEAAHPSPGQSAAGEGSHGAGGGQAAPAAPPVPPTCAPFRTACSN